MRYIAWLNATPEAPQQKDGRPPPAQRPRRDDIFDAGDFVPMPELEHGQYLVDLLFRIGPFQKDGPLDMLVLVAWQQAGVELSLWESETIIRLSQAYMAESHAATEPNAEPAWEDAIPMWNWVRNYKAERRLDAYENKVDRLARHKEKRIEYRK